MKHLICKSLLVSFFLLGAFAIAQSLRFEETLTISTGNIESEAGIDPPKPDHGRPLLYSADYGYKCGNCTGDDCGAICKKKKCVNE